VWGLAFLPLKSDLKGTVKNVTVMKKISEKRRLNEDWQVFVWED
jgi:hypothetical protein